jgi:hypothetical protein
MGKCVRGVVDTRKRRYQLNRGVGGLGAKGYHCASEDGKDVRK